MISNPRHGWVSVIIGEFNERASYLTDIPNDCLDAFIFAREKGAPAVIYFDAEGYDYHLVASCFYSYIILEKDELEVRQFGLSFMELANELADDIERNIDEWADWQSYNQYSDEELKKNKRRLEQKIGRLRQLLVASD